jgi:hypothetical protein
MGKNTYIILTILCLILIVLIHSATYQPSPRKRVIEINVGKEVIINSPYKGQFALLMLTYFILLAIGIGNIILFAVKKVSLLRQKKTTGVNKDADSHNKSHFSLLNLYHPTGNFPLSTGKVSKLFFLITFSIFIILGIGEIYGNSFKGKINPLSLPIYMNLFIETSITIIILCFLSTNYLGVNMRKTHLYSLFRIYTTLLPILLGSLFLNSFILQKIGIKPFFNPAIELIFLLKTKGLMFVLFFEVILLGPLAEELFFRGFLYKLTRKKYSFITASIIVSLLFSLLHRTPLHILPLFIISLGLCYLYEKTKNILAPIILHSLHNSLNLLFLLTIKSMIGK